MCLFHHKPKPHTTESASKENHPQVIGLYSTSPTVRYSGKRRSNQDILAKPTSPKTSFTGKRRSNQNIAITPDAKSSGTSVEEGSGAPAERLSREERELPMPRKTPGGLSQDPVRLGPTYQGRTTYQGGSQSPLQVDTGYDYASHTSSVGSTQMFQSINGAAFVAGVMIGEDAGFGGVHF